MVVRNDSNRREERLRVGFGRSAGLCGALLFRPVRGCAVAIGLAFVPLVVAPILQCQDMIPVTQCAEDFGAIQVVQHATVFYRIELAILAVQDELAAGQIFTFTGVGTSDALHHKPVIQELDAC